MSSLLMSLIRENPLPGLALASLNLIVALVLVSLSLSLGIAVSLLAWAHTFAAREEPARSHVAQRRLA
ncbi:hypothetical protein [Bradyrhizobium sp. Cp5.3]|uniref:hypothetical protein n=1 Tax=Bradyrhizobium sp. Cp5.3 TaxID=443598 RepID=UPI0004233D1C|nr:hypothetical protein [Bradyrhizobium sp. Cp5.3]